VVISCTVSRKQPREPSIDASDLQTEAQKVVRRLNRQGHKAYLVGGCVRDLLLGRQPKDFDVATSARPRQVKRCFRNSRIIGRRFKLVHVHFGRTVIEVATFRRAPRDDDEEDDRYIERDNVFGTEEEDAFRRDFTINALFYDLESDRVIDHVGGLDDLVERRVKLIGEPGVRLREDPVRILRAARFAGRLELDLTDDLRAASVDAAPDLERAAPPRVLEEIYRLLGSDHADVCFALLDELGALEVLLPELHPLSDWHKDALRRLAEATGGDRHGVPQPLLFAVLVAPLARPILLDKPVGAMDAALAEALAPLAERLSVPRRDSTLARHCLVGQARLLAPPKGRRAERFATRDLFGPTLALRRLLGPLEEGHEAAWEAWQERERAVDGDPASVEMPKTKRRRRGGRRRRGRGGGGGKGRAQQGQRGEKKSRGKK